MDPILHYNPQKPPLLGVLYCGGTNMFEPGAIQCRRAEGRKKGELWDMHTTPGGILTKKEAQALVELRKDYSRVILTAYKGVALVVMDIADYNHKA